ncbi:MAG: hypothetical protein H0T42_14260 [Deltaproteobacteria bacterium]|nr:hypothetical protein [Deltaproteobacteria bacterium]
MRSLVAALVLVVGCGDNIPTVGFEAFAPARREAECQRLARCGVFTAVDDCTAYFRAPFDLDLRAAVAAGRVSYDPAAAHACHAAIGAMSCDQTSAEVRTVLAECANEVFTGMLGAGAECAFDRECESGDCDAASCVPDTCCYGRCLAAVASAIDEPCDADQHCGDDAYCGTDHVCRELASTGMACALDSHCTAGLACIGATELQLGACRTLPLLGDACPYLRCAEVGAVCNPAQICVAVGIAGAPCTVDADCSEFRSCDPATSLCTDTPQLGMPCRGRCAGEAWCPLDGSSLGTCAAPQENTAPCFSNDQCASQFCAEGALFDTCAARAVCF